MFQFRIGRRHTSKAPCRHKDTLPSSPLKSHASFKDSIQTKGAYMPAIVPELIEMATGRTVSTTDLLRKSLVVSERLALPYFSNWINFELNGYKENPTPEYRKLKGEIKLLTTSGRPLPPSAALMQLINRELEINITEPIHEIEISIKDREELLREINIENKKIYKTRDIQFATKHINEIEIARGNRLAATLSTKKAQGICENVRTKILDIALDLEKNGIKGNGMTFNNKEKEIAKHYKITNINGQIQIDSPGSSQSQTKTVDTEKLCELVSALRKALDKDNSMSSDGRLELESELAALEAQARSPKPKWPIVNAAALSLKSILENAAGSALASAALPLLSQFL